jgi:hypothetical protein
MRKGSFLQPLVEKSAPEGAKVGVFAPFRVSRFFCKIIPFEKLFSKKIGTAQKRRPALASYAFLTVQ